MSFVRPWKRASGWRQYFPARGSTQVRHDGRGRRYTGRRYGGGAGGPGNRPKVRGLRTWLLGIASATIVSAASAALYWVAETYLRSSTSDKAVFAVIADPSDPIPNYQMNNSVTILTEVLPQRISRDDQVLVFKQTEDWREPVIVTFNESSPGRREELNVLFENRDFGDQEYNRFLARLRDALKQALKPSPQDFSPICEAVIATSRNPAFLNASQRTIVLLSDLLQHTPNYSAYKSGKLEELPEHCQADLTGFDVMLLVIERGHPKQKRAVSLFKRWVQESGGHLISRL